MSLLNYLQNIVNKNCISEDKNSVSLIYWSEIIFAKIVFVLVPLSLIAIVPAIIICLKTESYFILGFDIFCLIMLFLIGYIPKIKVNTRKISLIFLIYLAAFVLLVELGNFGPGLIYLLSATVFSLLLFPGKITFFPLILTFIFFVIFGALIYFNIFSIHLAPQIDLLEWVAVSSNVLFLSAIFTLMIPFFLSKLESTLTDKLTLINEINNTNEELKKSIKDVETKNNDLEQFAYIASHDLQEPLRMITSFMDKLKVKYENQLDEKAKSYIHFSVDGAKRMKRIINDLLEYSRTLNKNETLEQTDLNVIVEDYLKLRRNIIDEKSARILTNTTSLPTFKTYATSLTHVLHALLDNALKYTKTDVSPIIQLSVIEKEQVWEFSIIDNGIGIKPEFFDKIFVLFQRLHNQQEYAGTGIGLAVAKRHIDFLGGKIWLTSKMNHGTTFYFNVPKI